MVQPSGSQPLLGVNDSPDTTLLEFQASTFHSRENLISHISDQVRSCDHSTAITYNDFPKERFESVSTRLEQVLERDSCRITYNSVTKRLRICVMPSEVHESHMTWVKDVMGQWLQQGTLTFLEYRHLKLLASPRRRFTQGPYSGSTKEPDACIRPDNLVSPTFVVEAGWSEPRRELLDDMNLWLVGGNGQVNAVLILDWRRIGTSNRVEGVAELYVRDRQGMPICQQREQIFPAPNPQQAANQAIHVTRRVLFGPTVSQGRNPREVLNMSVDFLRSTGRDQMSLMGLVPA